MPTKNIIVGLINPTYKLNISKTKSLKPKSPQPNLLLDKIQEQQARNAVREITNTDARNGGKITEALRAYTLPRRNG